MDGITLYALAGRCTIYSRRVFKLGLAVCLAVLSLSWSGCNRASTDPWGGTAKKRVVCTIVPLHCFTATIAEPDAEVRCLLTTKGPHDFHPSPRDARLISSADLLIANGLGLEEFLDGLVRGSGNRGMTTLKTGEHIPKERLLVAEGVPHYHGDKLVVHRGTDPHVWLGPDEARFQIEAIRDALIKIDPQHAENYRRRTEKLLGDMRDLQESAKGMPSLGGGLVTFHDSFRYFGRSLGIPIAGAIRGLQGDEIAPAELHKQAQEFREKRVRVIGVEPQYPRALADNLATSIGNGAMVIELDPLETGPMDPERPYYVAKDWYLLKMKENLDRLRAAGQRVEK